MSFLGIGGEGGFLGTGIGASKPKAYVPKARDINQAAFQNPSLDYRANLLDQMGRVRAAPQTAAPTIDTQGFQNAGAGYTGALRQLGRERFGTTGAEAQGQQARNAQLGALGLMAGAAQGNAPSVAELSLRRGQEQALAGQAAMAASARGGAGAQALAQRGAAMNAATMQQGAAADTAALRAQEMAGAREAYITGTGNLRGADINTIGLGQGQQGLALQQAGLAQANQMNQLAPSIEQARLNQGANLANLQAGLDTQGQQDAYRLGILGNLGQLDARTQSGLIGYEDMATQQNVALEGQRAGQQPALWDRWNKTGGATSGFLSGVTSKIPGLGGLF